MKKNRFQNYTGVKVRYEKAKFATFFARLLGNNDVELDDITYPNIEGEEALEDLQQLHPEAEKYYIGSISVVGKEDFILVQYDDKRNVVKNGQGMKWYLLKALEGEPQIEVTFGINY